MSQRSWSKWNLESFFVEGERPSEQGGEPAPKWLNSRELQDFYPGHIGGSDRLTFRDLSLGFGTS